MIVFLLTLFPRDQSMGTPADGEEKLWSHQAQRWCTDYDFILMFCLCEKLQGPSRPVLPHEAKTAGSCICLRLWKWDVSLQKCKLTATKRHQHPCTGLMLHGWRRGEGDGAGRGCHWQRVASGVGPSKTLDQGDNSSGWQDASQHRRCKGLSSLCTKSRTPSRNSRNQKISQTCLWNIIWHSLAIIQLCPFHSAQSGLKDSFFYSLKSWNIVFHRVTGEFKESWCIN